MRTAEEQITAGAALAAATSEPVMALQGARQRWHNAQRPAAELAADELASARAAYAFSRAARSQKRPGALEHVQHLRPPPHAGEGVVGPSHIRDDRSHTTN